MPCGLLVGVAILWTTIWVDGDELGDGDGVYLPRISERE